MQKIVGRSPGPFIRESRYRGPSTHRPLHGHGPDLYRVLTFPTNPPSDREFGVFSSLKCVHMGHRFFASVAKNNSSGDSNLAVSSSIISAVNLRDLEAEAGTVNTPVGCTHE